MFGLSLAEVALIVAVAVVFIGPKDLPVILKALAKGMAVLKALAAELQEALDSLAREAGVKDMEEQVKSEIRYITGDDGKQYEAYDVPHVPRKPLPEQTDE